MPGHGDPILQTFDQWMVRVNKRLSRLERRQARVGGGTGSGAFLPPEEVPALMWGWEGGGTQASGAWVQVTGGTATTAVDITFAAGWATVHTDGWYQIHFVSRFTSNATGRRAVGLVVDTTELLHTQVILGAGSTGLLSIPTTTVMQVSAGTRISARTFQDSGVALTRGSAWFSMVRVS
jgi:hypothetical protein